MNILRLTAIIIASGCLLPGCKKTESKPVAAVPKSESPAAKVTEEPAAEKQDSGPPKSLLEVMAQRAKADAEASEAAKPEAAKVEPAEPKAAVTKPEEKPAEPKLVVKQPEEKPATPEPKSDPVLDDSLETRQEELLNGGVEEFTVKIGPDGEETRHGPARSYYPNGDVMKTEEYEDGVRHGEYVHVYKNGQTRGVGYFKKGLKHGHWTMWFESGQKRVEWDYVDDKMHGTHTMWDEQGKLTEKGEYVNGEKHGKWITVTDGKQVESQWNNGNELP